ncbi:MAG: deoxyribonuclease IV [Actinomycetota bacterium]|nr:deoxyribonuclease IV [Actinomycetota bacterium]MDQ3719365.1 deoxyribonuclease IV [Actinomycetota bacterium]
MLVGAHISSSGGLVATHERAAERGCEAMQIWGQSPRMWKATVPKENDVRQFCECMEDGPIKAVVIHAVYLINCASKDGEIRRKSLASLTHTLRLGDLIGASGVILHPGSAKGEPVEEALPRVAELLREALDESGSCPLLLENTAGAGDTLGRSFEELSELIRHCRGRQRLGICLDSCHMLASGFDIRTADKLAAAVDRCEELVGSGRVRCLHVNDSRTGLGSNRDRHAPPGEGELGARGCAAFLSEPRFEGLPGVFEGPGIAGKGAEKEDVDRLKDLRRSGRAARRRRRR